MTDNQRQNVSYDRFPGTGMESVILTGSLAIQVTWPKAFSSVDDRISLRHELHAEVATRLSLMLTQKLPFFPPVVFSIRMVIWKSLNVPDFIYLFFLPGSGGAQLITQKLIQNI